MSEVSVNRAKYKIFYSKSIDTMLTSLEKYLTFGMYSQEVIDIAILATAKVLSVNTCIYKEQNGKTLLITQTSDPPSSCNVYLKYECEHYDAICSMRPDQKKMVKDKISTSVDHLASNDIPLECGFTQNQINVYALEGTFFEAYRENGEKYLVMLTNVPATDPTIHSIISSNSKTECQSHQPHINIFFKPTNSQKNTNDNRQNCHIPPLKTTQPTVEDIGPDTDTEESNICELQTNYIFTPPKSTSVRHKLISPKLTPSESHDGHSFRSNEFILENGVMDFTDDRSVEEPNEHNNFSNILIGDVPSKF